MTIRLCGLIIIDTTLAQFADTTAIYTTLNQLVVDVVRSYCTERIVDRNGASGAVCCTGYCYPQMVCFSHSRQLIEVEKLRGFCQVRSVYLEEEVDGRTNALTF